MSEEKIKGACLCKKVTITLPKENDSVGVCHCGMCRKWGGGPFFALETSKESIDIQGEEDIQFFESSEWAERSFCKNCGTHLFYRLKDHSIYAVSSQLFENQNLKFETQIFIDEKPDYYDFSNKTKTLTGKEVFEASS